MPMMGATLQFICITKQHIQDRENQPYPQSKLHKMLIQNYVSRQNAAKNKKM